MLTSSIAAALCLVFSSGLQPQEFCYKPSQWTPGEYDVLHIRSGLLCRWNSRLCCVDLEAWN